jgi:hypothetical protein
LLTLDSGFQKTGPTAIPRSWYPIVLGIWPGLTPNCLPMGTKATRMMAMIKFMRQPEKLSAARMANLCALVSALTGWLGGRSGLRPALSMAARSHRSPRDASSTRGKRLSFMVRA